MNSAEAAFSGRARLGAGALLATGLLVIVMIMTASAAFSQSTTTAPPTSEPYGGGTTTSTGGSATTTTKVLGELATNTTAHGASNAGVSDAAGSGAPLPLTGFNLGIWIAIGGILILVGLIALVTARWYRNRAPV